MKAIVFALMALIVSGSLAYAQNERVGSSTTRMSTASSSNTIDELKGVSETTAVFGRPSRPSVGGVKLKARPGGDSKYTCNGYICYCKGSFDCVSMIAADKKCDNNTVGCNDDICVCSQAGTTGN